MNCRFISKRSSDWLRLCAFVLLICCLLLFLSGLSFAKIYKWKNDDGTTGFTDDLRNVPPQYRDQVETKEYSSDNPPPKADADADTDKETPQLEKKARPLPETDIPADEMKLSPEEEREMDKKLQEIKDSLGIQ